MRNEQAGFSFMITSSSRGFLRKFSRVSWRRLSHSRNYAEAAEIHTCKLCVNRAIIPLATNYREDSIPLLSLSLPSSIYLSIYLSRARVQAYFLYPFPPSFHRSSVVASFSRFTMQEKGSRRSRRRNGKIFSWI